MELDTTKDASVQAAAAEFSSRHDHLDVLVNNAGGNYDWDRRASTMDMAYAHETMELNLFGSWRTTVAFLPSLKKAVGARIVNVSSGGGTRTDQGDYPTAFGLLK